MNATVIIQEIPMPPAVVMRPAGGTDIVVIVMSGDGERIIGFNCGYANCRDSLKQATVLRDALQAVLEWMPDSSARDVQVRYLEGLDRFAQGEQQ